MFGLRICFVAVACDVSWDGYSLDVLRSNLFINSQATNLVFFLTAVSRSQVRDDAWADIGCFWNE